jgi:hypothetical protein
VLLLAAVFSIFSTFGFLTDIMTFGRRARLERVKLVLAAHAGRPLQELLDTLVADVRRHGPQLDDQSLLLVRVRIPDGS